jgi:hypothetical protein
MATITKEMKENLYICVNATQMWTGLNQQYQLQTEEHLHLLWQNYYDFNYTTGIILYSLLQTKFLKANYTFNLQPFQGDDMRTHIQKLSNVADKLREREQPLSNIQLVSKALATLPETFRIVRSVWASVPAADRTLDHLLQRLLTEENVVKSYQKIGNVTEGAFVANEGANGGYTHGRGGYPGVRGRGKKHFGVRGGFVDKRSRQHYRADQDSRPKCEYCTKPGHQEKDCYSKHGYPDVGDKGKHSTGLLSLSKPDPRSIFAFFADSGATKHMSDQRSFFSDFKPIEIGSWSVSGNNSFFL